MLAAAMRAAGRAKQQQQLGTAGGDGRSSGLAPGIDPLTNRFDLGSDPLAYFQRQLKLVRELWQRTQSRRLDADDDYQIYRRNLERGLARMRAAV